MDQPTFKTHSMIPAERTKGTDTVARLNAFLQYSGAIVSVYIPGHGEYAVMHIGIGEKDHSLLLLCRDPATSKNFSWGVTWDIHFNLYLGEK